MSESKRNSKRQNPQVPEFNIIPATPIQKSFAESEIESPQKVGPSDKRKSYVPPNYHKSIMPEESAVEFTESDHVGPIKVQWSPNLSLRSKQQTKPEDRRKSRFVLIIIVIHT
jgi:hypothetical protein